MLPQHRHHMLHHSQEPFVQTINHTVNTNHNCVLCCCCCFSSSLRLIPSPCVLSRLHRGYSFSVAVQTAALKVPLELQLSCWLLTFVVSVARTQPPYWLFWCGLFFLRWNRGFLFRARQMKGFNPKGWVMALKNTHVANKDAATEERALSKPAGKSTLTKQWQRPVCSDWSICIATKGFFFSLCEQLAVNS